MVARVKIISDAKANFGLVNVAKKEYAGKKGRPIYQKSAMIAGLM